MITWRLQLQVWVWDLQSYLHKKHIKVQALITILSISLWDFIFTIVCTWNMLVCQESFLLHHACSASLYSSYQNGYSGCRTQDLLHLRYWYPGDQMV